MKALRQGQLVCACIEKHARRPCSPAGSGEGDPSLGSPGMSLDRLPAGKEQVGIAEVCSPRGCPKDGGVPGRNPRFCSALTATQSSQHLPGAMLAPAALCLPVCAASAEAALLPITQPAAERQAAASLLLDVFCRGTCRACLANEKLLWIPLWAFQEGLARFLQSRHGKTVCFSKYVRDFSGTWLWQGLSAAVSLVVSLLGYTNRKVLSGTDTGLWGLSFSRVPAQIQPRLIASESCYLLTALLRSGHARSKQTWAAEKLPCRRG